MASTPKQTCLGLLLAAECQPRETSLEREVFARSSSLSTGPALLPLMAFTESCSIIHLRI